MNSGSKLKAIEFLLVISVALLFSSGAGLAQQQAEKPQTQVAQVIDYRIGAKDLLEIKVYELPELNQTVRVAEDGTITLAVIGPVAASGLTAQEL
ncbi:MAG: polysaccharide biosynthesis/export family protein, partial [Candidatus Saccharicenans sp.]|nr:polysaccharide biosynthesis/export family protein [Candidatus Saccharicenans sp.]